MHSTHTSSLTLSPPTPEAGQLKMTFLSWKGLSYRIDQSDAHGGDGKGRGQLPLMAGSIKDASGFSVTAPVSAALWGPNR